MKVCLYRTSGKEFLSPLVDGFEKSGEYIGSFYRKLKYYGDIEKEKLIDFIFNLNAVCNCEVIVEKSGTDGNELVYLEIYDDYRE